MTPTNLDLGELEFKVEDFKHEKFSTLSPLAQESVMATLEFCTERANRILRDKLAEAPTVYGNGLIPPGTDVDVCQYYEWNQIKDSEVDTHRARLILIEKLEGE